MITLRNQPANAAKLAQIQKALSEILAEILKRGFFGTAGIELGVQDGTIQHVRRRVERVER